MALRLIAILLMMPTVLLASELVGRVTDAETGLPLQGVVVRVDSLRTGAITDSAGQYRVADLPAGGLGIRLSRIGYRAVFQQVHLLPVGTTRLDVVLASEPIPESAVVVEAERDAVEDLYRAPSFITVIEPSAFNGSASSVADVLAATVGVKVKQMGGLGSYSTVSVRGSTSEQVTVYLDGIPLNTAMGGGVDLSTLPVSQVARMEVHRGAGAAGPAMGGSVYLRTPRADSSFSQSATVSWGSFDTRRTSVMLKGTQSGHRFVAAADYSSSDSNYGFLDDNGTEYNLQDDAPASRRNNDFSNTNLLGKWEREAEGMRTYLQTTLYWGQRGIPGISNNQSLEARLKTFRLLAEAGLEVPSFLRRHRMEHRVTFSHKGEHFIDRLGEVGVGRQDSDYRTRTANWMGQLKSSAGRSATVGLETDVGLEHFKPSSNLSSATALRTSRRWTVGARGTADVSLPSDVGLATFWGGLKRLRSRTAEENPFGAVAAADSLRTDVLSDVGGGLRFDLRSDLWLKMNVGWSHRAPSFFELFGDRGSIIGNTDLRPERGLSWDLGLRLQRSGRVLELVFYDHRYRDLIQFVQISQGTSRAFNIGSATVRGVEATGHLKASPYTDLSGSYTLKFSTDRSDVPHWRGNRLPGRPVHQVDVRAQTGLGSVRAFYDYAFEAGTFLDRANLRPVASRHIHGLGVRISVLEELDFTFEVENATNNRVADVWGYPLPGRTFTISLKETF